MINKEDIELQENTSTQFIDAESHGLQHESYELLSNRFSGAELSAMWLGVCAMLAAYVLCHLSGIAYGSLRHAQIIYLVFVSLNIFSALVALQAWSRIPNKSTARDTALLMTISTCFAAIGNSLDLVIWITNIAPFKQSILTNMFFIFAILFTLPAVHLLGRICRVEFSKQSLFVYITVMSIYIAIPFIMNPSLLHTFYSPENLKEFIFGLLYAIGLGYLASISLYLWVHAQGRLYHSARLLCIGLILLSFGCSIYAGLFPQMLSAKIPSNPVHIILALGYIACAFGIRRIEKTISAILNLKDPQLPPSLPLIEIFGPSQGLAVYQRMEDSIKMTLEELLRSKAESEMKQKIISELEAEVNLRKKTEKALIIEKEKAEEANKIKSQFLAMMSHELKTPLTAIKGYAQLLCMPSGPASEIAPQKIQEIANQVVFNSEHLQNMIDGILNFSQLENGKFSFHKEKFTLTTTLVALENLLLQQRQLSSSNFSMLIPDNELSLFMDRLSLQHIISNLLVNAFKFCRNGKITLEIRASGNDLFIAVEDTGLGMAPEHLDKIFQAFYQISHGNRRKYGGTGLGLAIVKKLTEELDGKIHVTSVPDKGSRFEIILPNVIVKDKTDE